MKAQKDFRPETVSELLIISGMAILILIVWLGVSRDINRNEVGNTAAVLVISLIWCLPVVIFVCPKLNRFRAGWVLLTLFVPPVSCIILGLLGFRMNDKAAVIYEKYYNLFREKKESIPEKEMNAFKKQLRKEFMVEVLTPEPLTAEAMSTPFPSLNTSPVPPPAEQEIKTCPACTARIEDGNICPKCGYVLQD